MKRKCAMCGGYFEEEEFRLKKNGKGFLFRDSYCKNCNRLYNKEYQRIYRERKKTNVKSVHRTNV